MREWQLKERIEGRWEVFGAARGGMGQVYFVRDLQWGGAQLAVKSLLLRHGQPPSNRAKALFLRESQVWLDLGAHPNIVSGFYTLEIEGALRFFMEYVPGVSLSSVLASGRQALPRALDFALQLALGLDYLHAQDVVHRDLKPQNCIVSDRDALRVTDFGLGKQLNTHEPPADSQEAAVNLSAAGLGTPLYMAPEQWRGLTHAGKPADVYAFGVVLYELLGGVHPFGNDSESWRRHSHHAPGPLAELLEQPAPSMLAVLQLMHQEVSPISLTELGVQAPDALLSLTNRCLEKDPAARPSFREIKQELLFLYVRLLGLRYPRQLPTPLARLTAGENNRAVSYYIMKDTAKAKEILARQLARDESALYLRLNELLLRVSCGELSPTAAALESQRFLRLMHPNAQDPQLEQLRERFAPYLSPHNQATAFAHSADKSTFAVGAFSGTLTLWQARSSQRAHLEASHAPIRGLSLSGDGALALVYAEGERAALLSTKTGEVLQRFEAEGEALVALSGDASLVAVSCAVTMLRLHDAKSGALLLKADAHDARLSVMTFGPDSRLLATASFGGSVKLWRLTHGLFGWRLTLLHTLSAHRGAVSALAFSADASLLFAAGLDGLCLVYSLAQKKLLHARSSEVPIVSLAVSLRGDAVLLGYQDGGVLRFQLGSQEPPVEHTGHQKPVWAVSFGGASTDLFSVSEEGVARWDTQEPPRPWPLLLEQSLSAPVQLEQEQERARLLALLRAAEAPDDNTARAFEALALLRQGSLQRQRDPEILHTLHATGRRLGRRTGLREVFVTQSFAPARRALFSPSHHLLLFGSRAPLLYTLHPELSSPCVLRGHSGELLDAAFSADGTNLITSAKDNTIRLWEDLAPSGEEPLFPVSTVAHPSWATAVCFVHRSDTFATACQKRVYYWHRGEQTPRWESPECSSWVTSLFASPDGESVYACCSDGACLCFATRDGALRFAYKASTPTEFSSWKALSSRPAGCQPQLFSEDSLLCAEGSAVLLRDARNHEAKTWLWRAEDAVQAVACAADRRLIAAGSVGKTTLLFDAFGAQVAALEGHQQPVCAVALPWDSLCVATSEEASCVRIFRADGSLLHTLELPFIGEHLSFDPSGRFLLAQGEEQARLWELVSAWQLG